MTNTHFLGLNEVTWVGLTAIAALLTVAVAGVAAYFALRQLRQGRELSEEQARPYLVAFIEENETDGQILDFVIRNIGSTAAREIQAYIDPPYVRAKEPGAHPFMRAMFFWEETSMLPPGAELRTMLDTKNDLYEVGETAGLPFTVKLSYKDRAHNEIAESYTLNPRYASGTLRTEVHGVHHIAKSLRAMAKNQGVSNF